MDIFENLGEAIKETLENVIEKNNTNIDTKRSNLSNDEVELAKKLDAIEEFTIDRFEGDFAVLEDRNTGKMLDVKKEDCVFVYANIYDALKRLTDKYKDMSYVIYNKILNYETKENID